MANPALPTLASDAEITSHVNQLARIIRAAGFAIVLDDSHRAYDLWKLANALRNAAERFEEDRKAGGK